jgi:tRNA dimethylallyltransferase
MIVIVGPTGVGKSALALELARKISGEIINADSMQIYKYMDIGTAKPSNEEFLAAPHHLFDILEDDEERLKIPHYLAWLCQYPYICIFAYCQH